MSPDQGGTAGRVVSLHRFPVKSLLGESTDELDVDDRGVGGDRVWSIRTSGNKIGSGKNTRRFAAVPGLLTLRARTAGDGVRVTLPSGDELRVDDPAAATVLSRVLGQEVTLARESDVSHFDDGPVSLLGVASVQAVAAALGSDVDPGRFRANIVVDGLPPLGEDALVGTGVRIGEVLLHIAMRSPRCVMVGMATADLPAQQGVLRAVGRLNDAHLGVVARVLEPGRIRVGDHVRVEGSSPG